MNDQPDHSPWYQPRTAEIIQRGGEGFANSIGQGMQRLAEGVAKGLEKKKEEDKSRAREFKALAEYGETRGYITKDQAITKDLDSLRGLIRGKEAAAVQEEQDLKKREMLQRIAAQQQQMDSSNAFGSAMQRASSSTMTIPNTTLPGIFADRTVQTTHAPTRDEIMSSLSATPGAWQSPQAKELLNYHLMQDPTGKAAAQLAFQEDPVSGKRFATFGNSISPSGINPIKAQATEFPDVRGYVKVPKGDGSFQYLLNKPNAQQSLELSRMKDRRDSIKTQIQAYDTKLASDPNAKTSFWGGTKLADEKAKLEKQLEDVHARIADLESGGENTPPIKPKAKGGDLWKDFMNSQK